MEKFFNPSSIAVYGVTPSKGNLGAYIFRNLREMGFNGSVYGVGLEKTTVMAYPVYTSLEDVPEQIELVTIITPAHTVPGIFEACGRLGIDRIAVITAGFNELGGEGQRLTEQILHIAKKYGIKFIGPNCQGLINFHTGVCLSFGLLKQHQINKGRTSIISQSGSVGWVTSLILSHDMNGISKVISIGNKLSVDEIQLTEFLMEDDQTDVILYYLESLTDGRRLCELAGKSKKPFVILKANRGVNSYLALSHTGALASDDRIVDHAFNQAGIFRAETFGDMLHWAKALSGTAVRGPNVVAMASSGGMALMCEDACRRAGLNLIDLPGNFKEKLREIGNPKIINHTNPIDLGNIFSNRKVLEVVKNVLAFDEVDAVILSTFNLGKDIHGRLAAEEFIRLAHEEASRAKKPLAFFWVTAPGAVFKLRRKTLFPMFDSIEDAVECIRKKLQVTASKSRIRYPGLGEFACKDIDHVQDVICSSRDDYLDDMEAMELLECYGINTVKRKLAENRDQLAEIAEWIEYPVAMKIHSRDISHKTDAGGVTLGIKDCDGLLKAYDDMLRKVKEVHLEGVTISGVKLQKMAHKGVDVIIGGKQDEDFGPVIMVGLGGIYTEVFDDVVFGIAPISKKDGLDMLKKLKGYQIFSGLRSAGPYDLSGLSEILARFSRLLVDFAQIAEADLNPVRVFNNGPQAVVLDARMFLKRAEKERGPGITV